MSRHHARLRDRNDDFDVDSGDYVVAANDRLDKIERLVKTVSEQQQVMMTSQQTTLERVNQIHEHVSIHTELLKHVVHSNAREVWTLRALLFACVFVAVLKMLV